MLRKSVAGFAMIAAGTLGILGLAGSVLAASFSATTRHDNLVTINIYVSGDKMRQDIIVDNRVDYTLIYRFDKGVVWNIYASNRDAYEERPIPKCKQYDELTSIGPGEKKIGFGDYAGYKCDKYKSTSVYTGKHHTETYTTISWYSKKLKAFVKHEVHPDATGSAGWCMTNIKEGPQSASLFELPRTPIKHRSINPETSNRLLGANFSANIKHSNRAQIQNGKIYVSGNKMRQDEIQCGRIVNTVIHRLDKGVIWHINARQEERTYTETPTSKSKEFNALADKGSGSKKIGVENYAGYVCDKYKGTSTWHGSTFTTINWYSPRLKVVVKTETHPAIFDDTWALIDIEEGPQPASVFELPKGLKKLP